MTRCEVIEKGVWKRGGVVRGDVELNFVWM